MKDYLSLGNAKLKKHGIASWGIEAGKTCPAAAACAKGCYAKQGLYVLRTVKAAHNRRLELSKSPNFILTISKEIKRRKIKTLRIHDSGDFYSLNYLKSWLEIIRENPQCRFYAYTKMIPLFKRRALPKNFKVIFSYGGKFDSQIIPEIHAHSKVFESQKDIKKFKYSDASQDDRIALRARKVGLAYHGANSKQWLTQ